MRINDAIRTVMKNKNITFQEIADAIGKKRGNDVSALLCTTKNMSIGNARKLLDALDYEIVIRPKGMSLSDDEISVTE